VKAAGSDDVRAIRKAIKGQRYDAPEGPIRIDPENQHAWKTFRLGRIIDGGQFEIVVGWGSPLRPEPYPRSRSRTEWDQFLQSWYTKWGNRWANPGS
jgi:urea transport system substrate-binding protein